MRTCELPVTPGPANAPNSQRGGQRHPGTGARRDLAIRPDALASRARLVALAVGGFLLPWCAVLSVTLPATARAQNWSTAWVGLDGAEAVAALATAALLTRNRVRAGLAAMAGGVLLLVDAWFDVCTSAPGVDHALALAEATFLELPLAGAAVWLAVTLTRRAAQPR